MPAEVRTLGLIWALGLIWLIGLLGLIRDSGMLISKPNRPLALTV